MEKSQKEIEKKLELDRIELHTHMWGQMTSSLALSHGELSASAAERFTNCIIKVSNLMKQLAKNPKGFKEWLTLKIDKPVSQAHIKRLENEMSFKSIVSLEEAALRPFVRAVRCDKFESPVVQKIADAVSDCYDAISRLQEALVEKEKFIASEERFQKGLRKSNPEISAKKNVAKKGVK